MKLIPAILGIQISYVNRHMRRDGKYAKNRRDKELRNGFTFFFTIGRISYRRPVQ